MRRPMLAALLAVAGAVLGALPGCGLQTQGVPGSGGEGGAGHATCTNDAQCNDHNPCTDDSCSSEGLCEHKARPEGSDSPSQKVGDCLTNKCVGGKEKAEPDDNDIHDDHEECTVDSCNAGIAVNDPKPEGAACTIGGSQGSCTAGMCVVSCSSTKPCPDPGACATVVCDESTGTCIKTPVPDGTPTPGFTQIAGDCHQRVCLAGVDVDQVDPSDVPITPTDCDQELCDDNGVPSNPPLPLDNPCSTAGGQVCNGDTANPACVECNDPTSVGKCPGKDDDCEQRTCVANKCGITYAPAGTPTTTTPAQVAGDCHQQQCDGAGNAVDQVLDADLPDDHNDCTVDICTNGASSHTNKMMGAICNGTLACDAKGGCTGCTTDSQCKVAGKMNDTCGGGNPGTPTVCGCTKTTCGLLGQTCGTPFDACYGNLACDTGTKNGSETDVDCGGDPTKCQTRCAQGKQCLVGSDCATGFCADGVCCDSACAGSCQACSAAKKGAGSDGVCGPIKLGTDPDGECTDAGAATCGTSGACNGAGACSKYAAGTTCLAASCAGNVLQKVDLCDGSGTCVDGGTQDCGNYTCKPGASCPTTCGSDADCNGAFCDATSHCSGKKLNGGSCTAANQCQSGICVDGVCCNTTCTGFCQACSAAKKGTGADGTCGNIKAGADPDSECTDQGAMSCGNDGFCDGAGACEKYASGTPCGAGSCLGNSAVGASTCNGTGTCLAGLTTACSPYVCTAGSCPNTCASDAQCFGTTFYCSGTSCVAKKANGTACGANNECTSAFCVDGVCCATACTGSCMACSAAKKGTAAGTDGTCGAVKVGTDPDNECTDQGSMTCGTNGSCDGVGACQKYPSGTVCQAAACSGNSAVAASVCNGGGGCNAGGTVACGAYLCTAGACTTSCTTDAQCSSTGYCSGGTCQPKKALGGLCTATNQCTSGSCADGYCCNTDCTGACQSCVGSKTVAGTNGTCSPIKAGTDPDNDCADQGATSCGTNGLCDGAGACQKYPAGTVCVACVPGSSTAPSLCDAAGSCVAQASCGNYSCTTTGCNTSCGGTLSGTDAKCDNSKAYCDGAGSAGACQAKKAAGVACDHNQDFECVNMSCISSTNVCN